MNLSIVLFINIFPRAQKRNRFFDPTSGCWDNFFIQSKLKWFWKRKPTSVRGVFSFILLIYPSWFNWISVFNRKKKNHPEQEFRVLKPSPIYRPGLRTLNRLRTLKLSQQPKVWSKNGLRFWTHRKMLIKSKISGFLYHDTWW